MNLQEIVLFEQALIQKSIDPIIKRQVKEQMEKMRMRRNVNEVPYGKMKFRCPICGQVESSKESKLIQLNGKRRRVCRKCGNK